MTLTAMKRVELSSLQKSAESLDFGLPEDFHQLGNQLPSAARSSLKHLSVCIAALAQKDPNASDLVVHMCTKDLTMAAFGVAMPKTGKFLLSYFFLFLFCFIFRFPVVHSVFCCVFCLVFGFFPFLCPFCIPFFKSSILSLSILYFFCAFFYTFLKLFESRFSCSTFCLHFHQFFF